MRNTTKQASAFSAFAKDHRFNAHGVPIVFYLKKIKTGQWGEQEVYLYYNEAKNIRGTVRGDVTREKAKQMVIKEVKREYPKLGFDIQFWR